MHKPNLILLPLVLLLPLINTACTVPDAQVVQQADAMNKQLDPAVMTDAQLASYLQKVGDRIIDSAKEFDAQHQGPKTHFQENSQWMFGQNMKFHFVNSKTLNAFTTGGEHMYIYNELFQKTKSEDELAAVMAHEYAHVYARHVGQGMKRQYTALAAAAALGGAGYLAGGKESGAQYAAIGAGAGALAGQFVNMGFTRKDENEADQWGFNFYTRAGWQPDHFADFFKSMIAMGYDKTPEMVSDHPTLANRVKATEERVQKLPPNAKQWLRPPIASPAQYRQIQARANQLGKTLPDDKSLANSQQLLQALPRSCVAPEDPADAIRAREEIARKAEEAQKRQHQQASPQQSSAQPDDAASSPPPKKKKPAAQTY
jgi:predicted Zn-dependent protease